MVSIIFESHATSVDNKAGRASGWNNPKLSSKGVQNAKDLGKRRPQKNLDAVFCSDMERAYRTAVLAYGDDPGFVFQDWRLRECDYGDFTLKPKEVISEERIKRIDRPFPNGESYQDCMRRMKAFLDDLKAKFDGKKVMVIGSRATHYGLEHWLTGKSLEECITEAWEWQPGWEYQLQ